MKPAGITPFPANDRPSTSASINRRGRMYCASVRMAVAHPEMILAIISQHGNACADGVSDDDSAPLRKAWKDPLAANRADVRKFVEPELTRFQ